MTKVEATHGIGRPIDEGLPNFGGRPVQPALEKGDGEYYSVYHFRPLGPKDPLTVRFEMLDEAGQLARVISAFRGREVAAEYTHGDRIVLPPGADITFYANWRRQKPPKRS